MARSSKIPPRPGKRLLKHDRSLGARFVGGCDEAGRGCLAGPLVAAAVVLDLDWINGPEAAPLGKLDDSKKLTQTVREDLYRVVLEKAKCVAISFVPASTIDRDGLHVSNIAAMRRAIARLDAPCELVLVDGFALGDVQLRDGSTRAARKIIKGDATSAAIAASAIIAKVTRDRLMVELNTQTSGRWAFDEHMGYATSLHSERIQEHGTSPFHRMSFAARAYEGAGTSSVAIPG